VNTREGWRGNSSQNWVENTNMTDCISRLFCRSIFLDDDILFWCLYSYSVPVTQVDVGMALIHIGLDELTSVLEVDAWMRLTWKDEYLTWNQSDYEGKARE
jgi:hypothetical protein